MDTPATERTIRGLAKVAKVYIQICVDFRLLISPYLGRNNLTMDVYEGLKELGMAISP
jgi:hypothetical protein